MSSARRSSTVDRRRLLAGVAGLATLACAPGASVAGASVAGASGAGASGAEASGAEAAAKGGSGEWRAYGATNAATKYSPLSQIDATNVANLRIAWEWESPDAAIIEANPGLAPGEFQATPIMADGVLYTSTAFCQVVAIDPATGRNIWVHDPGTWKRGKYTSKGMQHRGVAYWRDGDDARVIIGTGDNRLIALDARTGEPIESFGKGGEVDLGVVGLQRPLARDPVDLFASTSPPTICRDVIVMGQYIHDRVVASEMPPGDVRGFDVRTGELKWTFHTVPMEGEFGWDTWENGSAARNGNANVWAPMAADDELGLVYLPGSCPTNNFYGGDRPGDNLFGNALICLDVKTGERRWHYQFVRHDVWDLDLPCAPNLVDIRIGRRRIKAVAQVTKHGFTFVFDRVTGRPIWPIEDRPVPASTIKGEKLSPTQPFPTKPPPFEPQGMTQEMLIDWTPELREEAQAIMAEYKTGPLFTPFSVQLTIQRPAWGGGANWGGAAVDPETGVLYVPSISSVAALALDDEGKRVGTGETEEIAGSVRLVTGPRGLPLVKPPYGRITAIDLNRGEILWMKPNGPGASETPAFKGLDTGWVGSTGRTGPLLTKTLLFLGEGPHDLNSRRVLRAWDKATGAVVAETPLPGLTHGPPMTYMANGRQYVVCGMGFRRSPHKLVALALPDGA